MLAIASFALPTRASLAHFDAARYPRNSIRESARGRDYDRILFATPTRRLADKTQVFPMEANDSVRTRLTHSHEVSNLARSIGVRLAFEHAEAVFGSDHEILRVKRNVPSMLAAVGLAHDLGNPPFGHQGEIAIQCRITDESQDISEILRREMRLI